MVGKRHKANEPAPKKTSSTRESDVDWRSASSPAMQRVQRRAELAELEQEWQRKQREWMLYGRGHLPQKSQIANEMLQLVFGSCIWVFFGFYFNLTNNSQDLRRIYIEFPLLIFIVFLVLTVRYSITRYRIAEKYEIELQEYLKRREELSEQ